LLLIFFLILLFILLLLSGFAPRRTGRKIKSRSKIRKRSKRKSKSKRRNPREWSFQALPENTGGLTSPARRFGKDIWRDSWLDGALMSGLKVRDLRFLA